MQARRRTDILAAIVLVLAPAGLTAQSTQPSPAPAPTPSLFDPRRPPARELETRVPDGFTLAAVGDLITTRPLVQTLPSDPGFAAVVKILRDADTAYGNFETTAIDLGRFAGQSYPGRDDWPLAAPARGRPGPARARLRLRFAGQQPRDGLRDRGHAGDQPLARGRRHRLRRDRREPRRCPGRALSRAAHGADRSRLDGLDVPGLCRRPAGAGARARPARHQRPAHDEDLCGHARDAATAARREGRARGSGPGL